MIMSTITLNLREYFRQESSAFRMPHSTDSELSAVFESSKFRSAHRALCRSASVPRNLLHAKQENSPWKSSVYPAGEHLSTMDARRGLSGKRRDLYSAQCAGNGRILERGSVLLQVILGVSDASTT